MRRLGSRKLRAEGQKRKNGCSESVSTLAWKEEEEEELLQSCGEKESETFPHMQFVREGNGGVRGKP